ncbi:hypothetical protein [Polynucleobacter sp. AP-Nino-20-G2]|uniref:hypothetical protein n=1 Tax=Polynucleobacter sp. AP-Nino-20-G2 TaxID=2576917 RepID=UPI001BFD7D8E|nr:hypothetical protein [Polynucleobacter sp. AP-Nino-20-G2]QWE16902.1 hypothetical protein FD960_01360 [Polynucleobacter sp. AP-Nino-20-G2]
MSLLECLVGFALCLILVGPLLKNSGELITKQIELEKTQSLALEADRALELIGRAIRMAGYQNSPNPSTQKTQQSKHGFIQIQKSVGFRGSDSIMVKHEVSKGVDFDCIGNVISKERTKQHLAQHGFIVDRQASIPKGMRVNGGSLICQSLDRQGRIQNTTLMNGIDHLSIEPTQAGYQATGLSAKGAQTFRVRLEMTDGARIQRAFERTFSTRNF